MSCRSPSSWRRSRGAVRPRRASPSRAEKFDPHGLRATCMDRNESFLVTGALGCIGAWIVRRLVTEGVPVVAFDAGTDTRRLRLLLDDVQLSRVQLVRGDIAEMGPIERLLDEHRITHVIHLAALL